MHTMENIEDLKTAVLAIQVKDYGDFKRKTISYLNQFMENQQALSEPQAKQIHFMKWHIQYHPNLELNNTKLWTLQQLEKLSSKS